MEQALARVWADLDQCRGCRDPRFADSAAAAPAHPFRSPRPTPVLFLGEAPPKTGGFWRPRNSDAVRRLLLPILPAWPKRLDWDSQEAIDWFVDEGFFFVQAMKWTLAHQSYAKLTTRQKCLAVEHAVESHLISEIELMQPRAILALGMAAWDACLILVERYGQPALSESRFARARLRHHVLRLRKQDEVPLHVTFLPGRINEKIARRIEAMTDDVGVFLRCIDGSDCEEGERKAPSPAPRARRSTVSKAEFGEWKKRLKAVGLWGRWGDMAPTDFAEELARREAARQREAKGGGAC